jgi:LmbE family N-acetylglucosaminyl deacetylase
LSTVPRRKNVLFVLAHQDDECPLSTHIACELAAGHTVHCVFLTDGSARVDPGVRDAESRRVLGRLGVDASRIHFVGSRRGIPDGGLVGRLDDAFALLEDVVHGVALDRVYCLAYEGGHQDHDASHVVALALARRRRLVPHTWEVPFYNGYGVPGQLFRVQAMLPGRGHVHRRALSPGHALRHALLCLDFPSQWRTWIGLFPELFVKRAVLRREELRSVDVERVRRPPHAGALFYERRFGFAYDEFRAAVDAFLERTR